MCNMLSIIYNDTIRDKYENLLHCNIAVTLITLLSSALMNNSTIK